MKKLFVSEVNCQPSALNTSTSQNGVASLLASQSKQEPQFNGITIDDMRGNPLYQRVANIDKIGLAQKKIAEAGHAVSKSKFVRALNKQMQHPSKNQQN